MVVIGAGRRSPCAARPPRTPPTTPYLPYPHACPPAPRPHPEDPTVPRAARAARPTMPSTPERRGARHRRRLGAATVLALLATMLGAVASPAQALEIRKLRQGLLGQHERRHPHRREHADDLLHHERLQREHLRRGAGRDQRHEQEQRLQLRVRRHRRRRDDLQLLLRDPDHPGRRHRAVRPAGLGRQGRRDGRDQRRPRAARHGPAHAARRDSGAGHHHAGGRAVERPRVPGGPGRHGHRHRGRQRRLHDGERPVVLRRHRPVRRVVPGGRGLRPVRARAQPHGLHRLRRGRQRGRAPDLHRQRLPHPAERPGAHHARRRDLGGRPRLQRRHLPAGLLRRHRRAQPLGQRLQLLHHRGRRRRGRAHPVVREQPRHGRGPLHDPRGELPAERRDERRHHADHDERDLLPRCGHLRHGPVRPQAARRQVGRRGRRHQRRDDRARRHAALHGAGGEHRPGHLLGQHVLRRDPDRHHLRARVADRRRRGDDRRRR